MKKNIEYYFSPMSPWAYLGHERLNTIANRVGANIELRPVDPMKLFAATGGVPVAKRPIQRQKYRIYELNRWKSFLQSPIIIEPDFFPYNPLTASLVVIATDKLFGQDKGMLITQKLMEGCWVQNRDMGSDEEIRNCIEACDIDSETVMQSITTQETMNQYDENTELAIKNDVFGAPTYRIDGEPFWGQDRLDFVERALLD
ncbi:MAG: 2-hydroxychromene-2-carboxylate isomerase [Betaproteobacteria bacterium]|jgi:2-hydroxychromene-2-carboxylate isomerase